MVVDGVTVVGSGQSHSGSAWRPLPPPAAVLPPGGACPQEIRAPALPQIAHIWRRAEF